MVGSINPVVSGEGRKAGFLLSVSAYAVASATTAAAFGAALAAVGGPFRSALGSRAALGVLALLSVAYALHEIVGMPMPRPQRRRQVPSGWRVVLPNWAAAALYGGYLGPGFLTYVFASSYYIVVCACLLLLRPLEGAVVMSAFGAAKGLSILVRGFRVTSADDAFRRGLAICDSGARAHLVNGVTLSLAGLAYLAAALS